MFSFPSIESLVSVFVPIGNYAEEYSRHAKKYVPVKDRNAARREALGDVISSLWSGAGEAAFLAAAIFVGIRCLHWLPF